MIGVEDSIYTYEYDQYYKIMPMIHDWIDPKAINKGKKVPDGFVYSSDINTTWMKNDELLNWLKKSKITKLFF